MASADTSTTQARSALTPAATPAASTPQADAQSLTELDRLLVARLIEALKEEAPKASILAVAERFLSGRKSKLPPPPQPPLGPVSMPFPRLEPDYGTERRSQITEALETPFVEGKPNPKYQRAAS